MTLHLQKGIWQRGPLRKQLSAIVWRKSCPACIMTNHFTLVMPEMLATPMCFLAACVHVISRCADLCIPG